MEMTFAPREIIQIDDAIICFRNFEGRGDKFNREGDRNFAVIIETEEMRDALLERGWNVKTKPPREDGDEPFMYLPVKVKFNDRGPKVHLVSGRSDNILDEDSIHRLDRIYIASVDMDIRPYDWEVQGKAGRTAYLQSMRVVQSFDDRFASRFDDEEVPFE